MRDTDRPNRQSNMEKAEGDRWESEPAKQEPLVQRHPYGNDPTKLDVERTADEQSTVRNGGIGSGADRDPVLPSDDSTLNTKI